MNITERTPPRAVLALNVRRARKHCTVSSQGRSAYLSLSWPGDCLGGLMATFKRILVAIDFGDASGAALELAVELAARCDSELTLVHVWEFPSYEYLGGMPMPIDYADRLGEAARARMAGTINAIKSRCPNVKSIVRMGIAWSDVLGAAEETKAELLVVGTHGRRGLKRAILGSVAEKLVRLSPVPVLTVHSADKAA